MYPVGFEGPVPAFVYYDLWCQIMVRAIVTARQVYTLESLSTLNSTDESDLSGQLVSFEGSVHGSVAIPEDWKTKRVSRVLLRVREGQVTLRSVLELKTHYVYSMTAASALSGGIENGLLVFRHANSINRRGSRRTVQFTATPLIIGSGVLQIP